MTHTLHDPHVAYQNESFEYCRYIAFETDERTDDGACCRALYEMSEQRYRRLKDMDSANATRPIQEAQL